MNKQIREKTLIAIIVIGGMFCLNIEIGIMFYSWVSCHLFIWSLWCFFSMAGITWSVVNLEE
jgi:hypothetical protein